jgi:hypothetical protein
MVQLGRYELADHDVPDRIRRHRIEYPDTEVLEHAAAHLAQVDFGPAASLRFLRQVCRWGGYYGIAARVRNDNPPEELIGQALKAAWQQLEDGSAVRALYQVNQLKGLGRPSFASKLLRFLAPRRAAILDAVICQGTGFPPSLAGYGQLIAACRHAAEQLVAAGIFNPVRPDGAWYVADIEAAFYADMENFDA